MLSIGRLGAAQVGCYERQVAKGRDDYYSGRGEARGEWTGRAARALALRAWWRAQFNALMAGINPADPELAAPLRSSENRKQSVVGYDLTFSAPKSVSVLFAAADEETAGQLDRRARGGRARGTGLPEITAREIPRARLARPATNRETESLI